MLTSPISVTIAGTAHSLSKVNQDNYSSTFKKKGAGYEVVLQIRHSSEAMKVDGQFERHNVDLTYTTFDAELKPTSTQAYAVFRTKRGTDGQLLVDVAAALTGLVNSIATQVVAWES